MLLPVAEAQADPLDMKEAEADSVLPPLALTWDAEAVGLLRGELEAAVVGELLWLAEKELQGEAV